MYDLKGKYNSAEGSYHRSIDLDPSNVTAHQYLGQLYLEADIISAAINHLSIAQHLKPTDLSIMVNLGKILYTW